MISSCRYPVYLRKAFRIVAPHASLHVSSPSASTFGTQNTGKHTHGGCLHSTAYPRDTADSTLSYMKVCCSAVWLYGGINTRGIGVVNSSRQPPVIDPHKDGSCILNHSTFTCSKAGWPGGRLRTECNGPGARRGAGAAPILPCSTSVLILAFSFSLAACRSSLAVARRLNAECDSGSASSPPSEVRSTGSVWSRSRAMGSVPCPLSTEDSRSVCDVGLVGRSPGPVAPAGVVSGADSPQGCSCPGGAG